MQMAAEGENKPHIVLVHGACHGAWCWYKLKPLLQAAGHRVTALDLAASGIDPRSLKELETFEDYTRPLLDLLASLPPHDKVVLVGHSLGGLNISLAMEMFPDKIHVAVFVTAFLPDLVHAPSYWMNKMMEEAPKEVFIDTVFSSLTTPRVQLTSMLFGPECISAVLYQLSPPEDVELAKALLRPTSLFIQDLSGRRAFSKERFGSVRKVYVVCEEDRAIPVEFQRLLIETCGGVEEVKEMEGADHMPMISKPHQLCQYLHQIAQGCAF